MTPDRAPVLPRLSFRVRAPLAVPLVGALLLVLHAAPLLAQEVAWRSDYARALTESSQSGKPLVIDLVTDNCLWCKALDQRTFRDPETVSLLNERFVPLKVDATQNAYLAQALKVQSYPTLVYATSTGKILGYQEGFLEAGAFKEQLTKVLSAIGTPDWMTRDFQEATKAVGKADFARALSLLRGITEDGKDRPVQVRARQMLRDLEQQAAERTARAKTLLEGGKANEAADLINEVAKSYPDTPAVREGRQLLVTLASRNGGTEESRPAQARALLKQAREDYRAQQYLCCLDRCEHLVSSYSDLPEAGDAAQLAGEIKANPEWTKQAADKLAERLCGLYLSLADTWLRKGQPQQAVYYLERIIKTFPNTRHAEAAQVRLARLQGGPRLEEERK